jgi:hypothetical protein
MLSVFVVDVSPVVVVPVARMVIIMIAMSVPVTRVVIMVPMIRLANPRRTVPAINPPTTHLLHTDAGCVWQSLYKRRGAGGARRNDRGKQRSDCGGARATNLAGLSHDPLLNHSQITWSSHHERRMNFFRSFVIHLGGTAALT